MPARQSTETPLAPELEAIATAAADRVRAQADAGADVGELQHRVADAGSAAIAAGAALGAIAAAEQVGLARAPRGARVRCAQTRHARRPARTDPPRDRHRWRGRPWDGAAPSWPAPTPHQISHCPHRSPCRPTAASPNTDSRSDAHTRTAGTVLRHLASRGTERARQFSERNMAAVGEPVGQVIAIVPLPSEVDDARRRARRLEIVGDPVCSGAARAVAVHDRRDIAAREQSCPPWLPGVIARNRDGGPRERALIMSGGPSTSLDSHARRLT